MRWEDERYVRVYTRDTVDWLGLSFIAQGLFCLLLRKVDWAGILALGKHGKRAVAIAIGHPGDWPRLEPALEELIADGCVRVDGDHLVIPNFIEAQEATMSDRQRKAEQRARARDRVGQSADKTSRNVTERHETGQKVTGGHAESHAVTPNCAVPCLTKETFSPPTAELPPPVELPAVRRIEPDRYPAMVALIHALEAGGWVAGSPKDAVGRSAVDRIVARDSVEVCTQRLLDMVRRERDAGREPKPWLGWHMETLNGGPLGGDRKRNGASRGIADTEPWEPAPAPTRRPFDPLTGKERVS